MKTRVKKIYDLLLNIFFLVTIILLIVLKNIDTWIENKKLQDIVLIILGFFCSLIFIIGGILRQKAGDTRRGPYDWGTMIFLGAILTLISIIELVNWIRTYVFHK
ncbi:MAG TPA: hypothetical protein PK995_07995 [Bacteroidia bacterium]|nr:hypothetical protein [Bacteroidia bacterium]